MTLLTRGDRRLDPTSRIALLSLGFLLILSQVCSLPYAERIHASASSPPRKARFFATPQRLAGPPRPDFSEEEKRLVHTGPNPLHN
ncbi:hypothetical protein AAHA92_12170 [Salvia divinorum]|uniref:Uncharacterized protein n=1 Tax=Salvia divinorum TaxID=28513 RepID=A0ABD1HJF3_SALDI